MSAPVPRLRLAMRALGLGLASAAVLAALQTRHPAAPAPRIQQFNQRVTAYVKMLHTAESGVPTSKPTQSSAAVDQRRATVAARVRAARAHAKAGDIFSPAIAAQFRRWIAATLAGPNGHAIRVSLANAEPLRTQPLTVNSRYPSDVPLQSTPPSLLQDLPPLPKELEYRIVGRSLVLRDRDANLIVDFIPDALPASANPAP